MWIKHLENDTDFFNFIVQLIDCNRQQSQEILSLLFKPRAKKDMPYLNKKFKINCKIKSFENKDQLMTWITNEFAKEWTGLNDYHKKKPNLFHFYNALKIRIFKLCGSTDLFSQEDINTIKLSFRAEQKKLQRSDTLPLNMTLQDWFEYKK